MGKLGKFLALGAVWLVFLTAVGASIGFVIWLVRLIGGF